MKKKLIIIGASGHGKVCADIALKMDRWNNISFLDDDESLKSALGFDVIGKTKDAIKYIDEADFFVAVGNNATRNRIQTEVTSEGISIATLIHPNAVIGTDVKIGVGTAVMAGVVINSSSTIGDGCILNTRCSIDHDNSISDFAHISPGAVLAGTVNIGSEAWIGAGTTISNNICISNRCTVGAGALVVRDINETGTYIGIPVRKI